MDRCEVFDGAPVIDHQYLLTLVGGKLVEYLGLRCQVWAGLRFESQGRYVGSFRRAPF
jgi:hypothetical protein